MNQLHDLINRLRAGESERRIAQDLRVSRPTVHKYKLWAAERGYLDLAQPLPDLATLLAALGPVRQPPQMTSSLADHQSYVEQLLAQGVEMTAIWQRLREVYAYQGSYSAVRRFVQRLQPAEPTAFVRVQCGRVKSCKSISAVPASYSTRSAAGCGRPTSLWPP